MDTRPGDRITEELAALRRAAKTGALQSQLLTALVAASPPPAR
jgi:hypothetical protein